MRTARLLTYPIESHGGRGVCPPDADPLLDADPPPLLHTYPHPLLDADLPGHVTCDTRWEVNRPPCEQNDKQV